MKTITATALRSNLFQTIQGVVRGAPVRVRSRWGTVLLCREPSSYGDAVSDKPLTSREPKVRGRILRSLDDADEQLRKHIRVPR
ncbi:MAG: hypothetical protein GF331_16775 [Chitinivibrionales bacterium]|nr:hypothetical protein [Chitinivibrionales bacterium]